MGINAAISPVVVRVCFIFSLQFKEFELYWGAAVLTTRRGVLVERPFCVRTKCFGQTAQRIDENKEKRVIICFNSIQNCIYFGSISEHLNHR